MIGISFVDILIQAVFVLLIALIVGYVDPLVRIEMEQGSEYGQIGKDLCHKLDKDSLQACREHIEGKKVSVDSSSKTRYSGIGEDFCRSIGAANLEECRQRAIKELARLSPCLKPINEFQIASSLSFSLQSPSQLEFRGFSPRFLRRLEIENDLNRLQKARDITVKAIFEPGQINAVFGFIREKNCFHRINVNRPGRYSDEDLKDAQAAIGSLRRPAD